MGLIMQGTNEVRQIDSGNAPDPPWSILVVCANMGNTRVMASKVSGSVAQDRAGRDGQLLDAGSIVAGAVSLPIWAKQFGFGDDFVSLLGAMSSNAISAGIGALIGGRICDLWGRKKIYQYDLLLYAFGALKLSSAGRVNFGHRGVGRFRGGGSRVVRMARRHSTWSRESSCSG